MRGGVRIQDGTGEKTVRWEGCTAVHTPPKSETSDCFRVVCGDNSGIRVLCGVYD